MGGSCSCWLNVTVFDFLPDRWKTDLFFGNCPKKSKTCEQCNFLAFCLKTECLVFATSWGESSFFWGGSSGVSSHFLSKSSSLRSVLTFRPQNAALAWGVVTFYSLERQFSCERVPTCVFYISTSCHLPSGFLTSWLLGFLTSQLFGFWLFGFLASWLSGFLVFGFLWFGFLASWPLGFLVS